MKRTLHKNYLIKAIIILIIIVSGVFVYADGSNNNFTIDQVKIVKCYPNPATSVINFEFTSTPDKNATLQIYSFTGRKMTDQSLSSNKITITLDNNFYRGVYIYQLRDKAGRILETGKFQVVK